MLLCVLSLLILDVFVVLSVEKELLHTFKDFSHYCFTKFVWYKILWCFN